MGETKFTPGPWEMYGSCITGGSGTADGMVVAVLRVGHVTPGEDYDFLDPEHRSAEVTVRANGRLIAAAPDLYAACSAALARLDYLQDLWGKEGVTDGLVRQLREAIAKASPST